MLFEKFEIATLRYKDSKLKRRKVWKIMLQSKNILIINLKGH
jgi:hypothetical protein